MKSITFPTLLGSIVLFTLIFVSQSNIFANNTNEMDPLQRANTAYSEGKYVEAIKEYEQILSRDGMSPSVLYNLGNSYAQMGNTGKAILNYERAQLLSHGDSDIQGNLDLLQKNQGLFQEELSFDKKILHLLRLNQWALLAITALVILTALQVASLFLPLGRQLKIWSSICLAFLLLTSSIAVSLQYGRWHSAVIIEPDVRLLLSPFPSASSTGMVKQGRLVLPEKKHGAFYLVKEETGRTGWIPASAIEFITTPPKTLNEE